MSKRTCALCHVPFPGVRRFCYSCCPPHGDFATKNEYAAVYNACMRGAAAGLSVPLAPRPPVERKSPKPPMPVLSFDVACKYCAKVFTVLTTSQPKPGTRVCSNKCSARHQRRGVRVERRASTAPPPPPTPDTPPATIVVRWKAKEWPASFFRSATHGDAIDALPQRPPHLRQHCSRCSANLVEWWTVAGYSVSTLCWICHMGNMRVRQTGYSYPQLVVDVKIALPVPCGQCGAMHKRASARWSYCSEPCRKLALQDRTRRQGFRRYSIAGQEPYTLMEIFQRDGDRCCLCGKKGIDIYDSSSFNVEHRLPKSKGGLDTLANVGLAHPLCNNQKGNGLFRGQPEQLRLVG